MEENEIEKTDKTEIIEIKSPKIELSLETKPDLNTQTQELDVTLETNEENESNKIEEITEFIKNVQEDIQVRNERDKYKDEAIQRMSKQIADFEKGIFEKIKKELINEIISFYDLLLNFQKKFKDIENKELQIEIDFLETEISNILFNNSIDEIDESIGEDVNRDLHRIKKKVESNDIDKNQKILEVLKKGFIWNDKILRKQDVIISDYKEKENINE